MYNRHHRQQRGASHEYFQVSGVFEGGVLRYLYQGGGGTELHPVRHQPCHHVAGERAGHHAPQPQPGRCGADGGRPGRAAQDREAVRRPSRSHADGGGPKGHGQRPCEDRHLFQRVGPVAAPDTEELRQAVPQHRVRGGHRRLLRPDRELDRHRRGGLRLSAAALGEAAADLRPAPGRIAGHRALRPPLRGQRPLP